MKKAIVAIILLVSLTLSAVCLTSCSKGQVVVDSINGKTPLEAFNAAKEAIEASFEHLVEMDLNLEVKYLPIKLIKLDNFCVYTYKGENESHIISDEAFETLEKYDMESVFAGFNEVTCYVDGICYEKKDGNKIKYEAEKSPIGDSDYEVAIAEIIEEGQDKIECYLKEGQYYFQVKIEDPNLTKLGMGASDELYRVYLTADGLLDKIEIECTVATLGVIKINIQYGYTNIPDITAPADAADYVDKK